MKIVSLLPSSTEILCRLGFKNYLVGRSHECDFPEGVSHLPVLTAPKFNKYVDSATINKSVAALLEHGLSVYKLDTDLLESLAPDFIVTQSQCEVCAVSMKDVEKAACALMSSNPIIINLEPNNLDDVYDDILKTALALGVADKGSEVRREIQESLSAIESKTQGLEHPSIACIEWLDPLMLAANWVPELVEIAGGTNVLAKKGTHSNFYKWEDIRVQDPDIIAVMPCGFGIDRTLEEMDLLTNLPGWKDLRAVRNQKVFITDGNQFFNRPGPRLLESTEILAEILHPKLFNFGHQQKSYSTL